MKLLSKKMSLLAAAATTTLALSGCGKQTFETVSSVSQNQAPGFFQIAPKVDILLAQDNTGSMHSIYNDIGSQMPAFLDQLAASGWDYHFASIPLTSNNMNQQLFSEVLASKQDRNWGISDWLAPFPGAQFNDPDSGEVAASYFRKPFEYTDYHTKLYPTTSLNGMEPGLENIRLQLKNHMGASNFHRPDAMLVVIVVGNGNDTSGVKICRRFDGVEAPCELSGMGGSSSTLATCASLPSSLRDSFGNPTVTCVSSCGGTPGLSVANNCSPGALASNPGNLTPGTYAYAREFYKQELQTLRPSSSQVKLYAAVSTQSGSSNCYGAASFAGTQYISTASSLGGTSHNICSSGAASVLESIRSSLQVQKMALRTIYLMMDGEPDVSSIRVVRYIDGDRNRPEEIQQSATNGWTYAGLIVDQPRVVTDTANPVAMNRATGYAVRLNGTARLSGADTAEVTFLPRTN